MNIRLILVFGALAAVTVTVAPARAGELAWYRFGDDDGGPVNGGDIDEIVNSAGTFPSMTDNIAKPDYSNVVPAPAVYDPITDTIVENRWSLLAPGLSASERVRTTSSQSVPSVFSYETFVRFDDLGDSPTFAYHRSSAANGWAISLQGNDRIRVEFNYKEAGVPSDLLASTTALTEGEWYHVGLIVTGNSQNGSDDAHLFINYVNEASINLNDGYSLSGSTLLYSGNVFSTQTLGQDESRYFSHVLALDGSQFLRSVPEPSGLAILAVGSIALFGCGWRRKRRC